MINHKGSHKADPEVRYDEARHEALNFTQITRGTTVWPRVNHESVRGTTLVVTTKNTDAYAQLCSH